VSDVEEEESTRNREAQEFRELESQIQSTYFNSGRSPSVELEPGSQIESVYSPLVYEYGNWTVDKYVEKYGESALVEIAQEPERAIERLAQGLMLNPPDFSLVQETVAEANKGSVSDQARDKYQRGMASSTRHRYDEAVLHFSESWETALASKDRLYMAHSSRELSELADELGPRSLASDWCLRSAMCYGQLGFESYEEGDYGTARQLRQEELEMRNKLLTLGTLLKFDRITILALQDDVAGTLRNLAFAIENQGDTEESRKQLQISGQAFVKTQQAAREEGLERQLLKWRPDTYEWVLDVFERLEDKKGQAYGLHWVGTETLLEGKLDEARKRFERSAKLSDELLDHWGYAESLLYIGIITFYGGDLDKARELFKRDLEFSTEMGIAKAAADSLVWLANVAFEQGEEDEGHQRLRQSVPLYQRFELAAMAGKLGEFAELARKLDKPETAQRLEERNQQITEFAAPSYFAPSY